MFDAMLTWVREHDTVVWWLASSSVVLFVGTLIAVPVLAARIPADYFADERRHATPWSAHHPALAWTLRIGKTLIGLVLLLGGIAMLLLPGQGLLAMAIGLMLMEYPGKYRIERWFVGLGPVLRSINWLRRRADRSPLVID